ncbi:MAG: flavin reductase family protein [Curvibacter lanceolatus]|uniref:flavin reductase family protein n=1 Tax=Curvibacter lanceolatus TaxID=86182 RepID=UPI0004CF910B|nr:flavin reductase family protein [Curvibacter lanceolatus]MBV5295606.1 flavin reductase family protein [Curvibacter lanceolatus]
MQDRYFYAPREGHGLKHNPIASIVGPRPIGWISSMSEDGSLNLAPYSFFGIFNYAPPIVAFASAGIKDTLRNAIRRGEFVVNVVTESLAQAMNLSSSSIVGSEFELTQLGSAPSTRIATPRVEASPVSLECQVLEDFPLRDHQHEPVGSHLLLAEVIGVSIDRSLIVEGVFSWGQTRTVVRAGGAADYHWIGADNLLRLRRPD